MIEFSDISKHFGTQTVLDQVDLRVLPGERVGIIGPNGSGKSTILRLISGEMSSDGGKIILPKSLRLGYLRQQLNPHEVAESLLEYTTQSIPRLKMLQEDMEKLEISLQQQPDDAVALSKLGDLQHEFEHLGGYEMETRARSALGGLGFEERRFSDPFTSFSGGWQMRAELARTLIGHPDLLLLDEPSNYLDVPAIEWLQRFLKDFPGTMLLVSHDRYLLESLSTVTLEVNGGRVTRYPGNYSYYERERENRRMQEDAERRNLERKRADIERFVERFRAKATKASQVQSRIKQLEKMDLPQQRTAAVRSIPIALPEPPHCGHEVVRLENAGFSYDGQTWIFKQQDLRVTNGEKLALVGYNGMGKTTLLRVLAQARQPGEGVCVLGHQVIQGYQSQEFAETMPPDEVLFSVVKQMNPGRSDADVRGLLGRFGFSGDAIDKPVSVLSGGEKIRLAFARLFANPPNFLLLDEPTTHLDIEGRRALEQALKHYGGTVCLVSHDIQFVRAVAEGIIEVNHGQITRFHGDYEYYLEKNAANATTSAGQPAGASGREARKARGASREQLKAQLREQRKILRKAEEAIESLEEEQQLLLEDLSANPDCDYATINRRIAEITTELERQNELWESSAMALEELSE